MNPRLESISSSRITPSALVKLASTWIKTGNIFGPSETLRGLRNARRIQRRPVRRTRNANGVTRCTARSIVSATDETSSVMDGGCEFYAKPPSDAMRAHEYKVKSLTKSERQRRKE